MIRQISNKGSTHYVVKLMTSYAILEKGLTENLGHSIFYTR